MSGRPSGVELLAQGSGFLLRTDLRDLGLNRRAVDAAFSNCPVIDLSPDYGKPMIRVEAFIAYTEGRTYCDRCGDRVRPGRRRE